MVRNTKFKQIHEILKEWNPIGVPEPVLSTEYESYVLPIIATNGNEKELIAYLEKLLVDIIGVDYDRNNPEHKRDLMMIVDKIKPAVIS